MDLASYADLVIELVNTTCSNEPEEDSLRDLDALRSLLTFHPYLSGRVTRQDLDAMRDLRTELRKIFESVAADDEADAVERLNSLLIQHPIHPQMSGHDGHRWHLHLIESGSVPDRFAAGAAMGLAVYISGHGIDRLGLCRAPSCDYAYFDDTANRSRRYCSDRCASRAHVTTYRTRLRESTDAETDSRDGGQ